MPSYKKHVLFSIIMALPFFPDVFYLSLAVLGASMLDMDHDVNRKNLTIMALIGMVIALALYILNLPFLIGLILVVLAMVFYVSKHRGFMHSILGICLISGFMAVFVMGSRLVLQDFTVPLKLALIFISLVLAFIILNRKLLPVFAVLVSLGIFLTPNYLLNSMNICYVFSAVLLGCLSHVILDMSTPAGVRILSPISSRKYRKKAAFGLFSLWVVVVFIFFVNGGWGSVLQVL
ncbi:metal-dependent hydrolase [Methanobacterium aggregans]|uniref:metal-dependent hydrolase n=1 Tax=Methanobacterium aggregans TaxID=1615586 RepID=UPI001AEB2EBD|nr:metal-dependent hydrolase [Methanobacterium aggregans]MBP2046414.1 inner membrane protein [Methanobacterium aggregans]